VSDKPSSIRNIGPASDEFYGRAGITTADQLRDLGPDEAYFRALQAGGKPHFIGYYAMVMGLQGRPWNDCQGSEKVDLQKRFDVIKARLSPKDKGCSEIEAALDALGVVRKL
jgi:hypothetical protein